MKGEYLVFGHTDSTKSKFFHPQFSIGTTATLLSILSILFFVLGCIQPVQQVGCCLPGDLSKGCILYNTTSFISQPEYQAKTNGPCDSSDTRYNTTGYCNVTISNRALLVPICTENKLAECIGGNCTAMICGDFKYTPKVPPGFIDVEDAVGSIPVSTETEAVEQFYKAQCKFLPMDAKVRQLMKGSSSQINVFRMGVGGSFDEYSQYRYMFPLSDAFCGLNPPVLPGEIRVDRYMNYLGADLKPYDPRQITDNCFDPNLLSKKPYGFDEPVTQTGYLLGGLVFPYSTILPDNSNYKFTQINRIDFQAKYDRYFDSEENRAQTFYLGYNQPVSINGSNFKKLDEQFYKKALTAAYGLNTGTNNRAPFECVEGANQCYSGQCNTEVYRRETLVSSDQTNLKDISTECRTSKDKSGQVSLVCPAANSISYPVDPKDPISVGYGSVTVSTMELNFYYIDAGTLTDADLYDKNTLDQISFEEQYGSTINFANIGKFTFAPSSIKYEKKKKDDCTTYAGSDSGDIKCGSAEQSDSPPIGGVVFFGKPAQLPSLYYNYHADKNKWEKDTIIGYAISSPDSFSNIPVIKNCQLTADDYFEIDLTPNERSINLRGSWEYLDAAFTPLIKQRLQAIADEGDLKDSCGDKINAADIFLSTLPWFLSYAKVDDLNEDSVESESERYLVSSSIGKFLDKVNPYEFKQTSLPLADSCNLRKTHEDQPKKGQNYVATISKYIYLLKYVPGSGKIGKCAVDDGTYLPKTRVYGWCNACSSSTLAYQKITATSQPYMPSVSIDIGDKRGIVKPVCEEAGTVALEPPLFKSRVFPHAPSGILSCRNGIIEDMKDYDLNIGSTGSSRSIPESSVLTQRLAEYMKSGVLPVLDLSDKSNWNLTDPLKGYPYEAFGKAPDNNYIAGFPGRLHTDKYSNYDFESLIGKLGAAVTIIDTISDNPSELDRTTISERATLVRSRCNGCIIAFHVSSSLTNQSFNKTISYILSDVRARTSIDMVTFDYSVSNHPDVIKDPDQISLDLAAYGHVALAGTGKPSMVVGFNMPSNTNSGVSSKIFSSIVSGEDKLIKSGIIGIVYSPVRNENGAKSGLVDIISGVGVKNGLFCAVQKGLQLTSATSPTSVFSKTIAAKETLCAPCTTADRALGLCGGSALKCDDGGLCKLPDGLSESDARCPVDSVSIASCNLCKDNSASYTCTYRYQNGSKEEKTGSLKNIDSEIYLDVIGGLSRPDKCCLITANGVKYTFSKKTINSPIDKPIVYPQTGDPDSDCGFGSTEGADQLSGFCGVPLPVKNFDITCKVN